MCCDLCAVGASAWVGSMDLASGSPSRAPPASPCALCPSPSASRGPCTASLAVGGSGSSSPRPCAPARPPCRAPLTRPWLAEAHRDLLRARGAWQGGDDRPGATAQAMHRSHLSTICRRTLGVRLKLPLDMPNGTGSQRLRLRVLEVEKLSVT